MKNLPVRRAFPSWQILIVFPAIFFAILIFIFAFFVYVFQLSPTDSYYYMWSLYTPTRLLYLLALAGAGSVTWIYKRQRGYHNLHGSSRWATVAELRWKGYFKRKSGIVLGMLKGKILTNWSDTHVLLVAPTRSGKSVSTSIPTLLENEHNIFALDIKGELHEKTYLWRKWFFGQKIILLDPADTRTARFNPLSVISIDSQTTLADIGRIAAILYPPIHGDGQMWQDLAKNLFTYSAYYLVLRNHGEGRSAPTLADINNLWSAEIEDIAEEIETVCTQNKTIQAIDLEGQIVKEIEQFSATTEKARSSILTTFVAALKLFIDPSVRDFTSETTLDFDEFMYCPATIYFSVKPNDLNRLAPLINIFVELLLNGLSRKMDEKRRTIYFLLDEFTAIGKVQTIAKALAYLASYKVRFCFIVQNLAQLKNLYKDEMDVILSNCHVKIFSAVAEPTTQRYIMDLLGNITLLARRLQGRVDEVKRPLMTMEEIATMPGITNKRGRPQSGKLILVINNMPPVLCGRVVYFKLPYFTSKIFTM